MGTSDCPSSVPEHLNSRLFGIVEGTVSAPRVTYLQSPQPVTPQLLALTNPVEPTEVFRFAADCLEQGCQYFSQEQCQLVKRIVNGLPEVTSDLPLAQFADLVDGGNKQVKQPVFVAPKLSAPITTLLKQPKL